MTEYFASFVVTVNANMPEQTSAGGWPRLAE
jgi:hypothetical protein